MRNVKQSSQHPSLILDFYKDYFLPQTWAHTTRTVSGTLKTYLWSAIYYIIIAAQSLTRMSPTTSLWRYSIWARAWQNQHFGCVTKPTFWIPTRSDTNRAVQSQKKASRGIAKTMSLISFAVTAKLICAFVFAFANCWFSHARAHVRHVHLDYRTSSAVSLGRFSLAFLTQNNVSCKQSIISSDYRKLNLFLSFLS